MVTELEGRTWLVDGGIDLAPGVEATIGFEDDAMFGSTGCNNFRAPVERTGGTLRVAGPVITTRRACAPPADAVERTFLACLDRIAGYSLGDNELVLLDAGGDPLLHLVGQGEDDLIGTWQVVAIHWPDRAAIVGTDDDLTLVIEDEVVHGSGGCNTFRGGWSADGTSLTLGPLAATLRAGPPEAMAQERALFQALGATHGFRLAGSVLDLLRDDGGIAVTLRRAEG